MNGTTNLIYVLLNIMGGVAIAGGIVIGFATYDTILPDYGILFGWIGAGVVSSVMFFGFAEIINLLDNHKRIAEEHMNLLKGKQEKAG